MRAPELWRQCREMPSNQLVTRSIIIQFRNVCVCFHMIVFMVKSERVFSMVLIRNRIRNSATKHKSNSGLPADAVTTEGARLEARWTTRSMATSGMTSVRRWTSQRGYARSSSTTRRVPASSRSSSRTRCAPRLRSPSFRIVSRVPSPQRSDPFAPSRNPRTMPARGR